jgi:hypothetical protein
VQRASSGIIRPIREAEYGADLAAKLGAFVEARELLHQHVLTCSWCVRGEICTVGHDLQVEADATAVAVGLIGRNLTGVNKLCHFSYLLSRAEDLLPELAAGSTDDIEAWVKGLLRAVQARRRATA